MSKSFIPGRERSEVKEWKGSLKVIGYKNTNKAAGSSHSKLSKLK
jgi:hypothetical protein